MSSRAWKQHIAKVTTDGRDVPLFHIDCPAAKTEEKGILLLSRGFPETSYQYRHILKPLSEAGYRLIVPDIECHGASSHPPYGYTKSELADDFYNLLQYHLQITKPIYIVGYDLGGMIAYAFAVWCPSYVKALIWGKFPLPKTTVFKGTKAGKMQFHFAFQALVDLAVHLVTGKEKEYFKDLDDKLSYNANGIPPEALDHYAMMYSQPGALRAAFSTYEAFEVNADENLKSLEEKGKCKIPILGLNGELSHHVNDMESMLSEMYENYTTDLDPESGHFVAKENSDGFVESLLRFLAKHT